MDKIGITETVAALRSELAAAVLAADGQDISFPVNELIVEFNVGVTKSVEGGGGIKFWVVNLDAKASYKSESIQKVTMRLGPPVGVDGMPVKVRREQTAKP